MSAPVVRFLPEVKGRDPVDLDTRGGFLAFGLLESQVVGEVER